MPGKASNGVRIADIIHGFNRVVNTKNYDDTIFDNTPDLATNRGNKLKRKAEYAHEGRLAGKRPYKSAIDHAGFSRNIVFRNPPRYDEEGMELDSDEDDKQADADAAERNPYHGVEIKDLLMPLTSVSGLWNHPGMSHAYTSEAITDMVSKTREMLRKERNTLSLIKEFTTKLRGDHCRVPSSMLLAEDDADLYSADEILKGLPEISTSSATLSRTPEAVIAVNVVAADETTTNGAKEEGIQAEDVNMAEGDAQPPNTTNGTTEAGSSAKEGENGAAQDANGASAASRLDQNNAVDRMDHETSNQADDRRQTDNAEDHQGDNDQGHSDSPVPRMMTRGAAAAANGTTSHDQDPDKPRSPSPQASLPAIHPAFLPPRSSVPDRDLGLPPWEAEETRKLANVFIQKQEEVVRGVEKLHDGFLRAERLRQKVYHWSRADEHTGQLSDGEDWVDEDQWGLTEPLKKGATEGEEEGREEERKGKGRRARAAV